MSYSCRKPDDLEAIDDAADVPTNVAGSATTALLPAEKIEACACVYVLPHIRRSHVFISPYSRLSLFFLSV